MATGRDGWPEESVEPEACFHIALHCCGVHHGYSASLCRAEGADQPLRSD